MATIPNNPKSIIIKHYQMIVITQDGPIVLTTSLSVKDDDLNIQDKNLVSALLNSQFLLKLKFKVLAEHTYIPCVQQILSIDKISELIEYEWGKPFGYLIQDITNPKHPITLIHWSIEDE